MFENPYEAPSVDLPARPASIRKFTFRFVDSKGQGTSNFPKHGEIGDDALMLDGISVPMPAFARVLVRQNRLALVVRAEQEFDTVDLDILSGPRKGRAIAVEIKQRIDQAVSIGRVRLRRKQLEECGQGETFRAENCPHCGSTIDLSGFDRTPQVYCAYCEAIATLDAERPIDEAHFRLCDSCGFYGRPDLFHSSVLIYLIFATIWRNQTSFVCHACMRREGWKTLRDNLWTLLGAPTAAYRLWRVYQGRSARSTVFRGLASANSQALRRRPEPAEELYGQILGRTRHAAGIHYNRALARAMVEDWRGALDAIQSVWSDCSNYPLALPLALLALKSLGRPADAAALEALWEKRSGSIGAPGMRS